jgi:RNA polymerase sigma-70 factor (ECF subfamily)
MLDNHSDAEDITQETMLRAWTRYETFNTTCSFHTWICRIATNLCIDQLRYRKRAPVLPLNIQSDANSNSESGYLEIADSSNDPAMQLLAKHIDERLYDGILKLPESQRKCLLLLNNAHSYQEIANILQCPLGTVRSRLHRARGRLQGVL